MLNNQYHGITVEDLEKAASVRLFEKAAAAEGLNLNELSDTQVDDLYSNYQHSSEENTMNEEIFDLFEKQAAYEGVDLDALSDEELAYVFDNFVENLDADYDEYDDYDYDEEEAYEKLAEAEILGRHMARAYMDEMEKEAGALAVTQARDKKKEAFEQAIRDQNASRMKREYEMGMRERKLSKKGRAEAKRLAIGQSAGEKMRSSGRGAMKHLSKHKLKYGLGAGALGLGGAAYAMGRRGQEKQAATEEDLRRMQMGNMFAGPIGAAVGAAPGERMKAFGGAMGGGYVGGLAGGAAGGALGLVPGYLLGGRTGAALGGLGGAALGGMAGQIYGGHKGLEDTFAEKQASDTINYLAVERANEFIEFGKEAGYDGSSLDNYALELLESEGWDLSPLYY